MNKTCDHNITNKKIPSRIFPSDSALKFSANWNTPHMNIVPNRLIYPIISVWCEYNDI